MQSDSAYAKNYFITQTKFDNYRMSLNKKQSNYLIPIVVHIIHKGENIGTGNNITDNIVNQAIKGLNDRFKGAIGAKMDIGIQFQLASKDPGGCPTNGIRRVNMGTINTNPLFAEAVKAATAWPNDQYYNIWVVPDDQLTDIGNSHYPDVSPNYLDGTMIRKSYFTYNSHVLTHELGHGFNLMHTFESGCSNSDCSKDGDKVCDTPPHEFTDCDTNTCKDSANWGNSKYNYMSYCNSVSTFTQGQKDRMIKTFSASVRQYLLNTKGLDRFYDNNITLSYSHILCDSLLTVNIKNSGSKRLDSALVHWSINNARPKYKKWYGNLTPCQSTLFVITDTAFISQSHKSEIKIWVSLPNGQKDSSSDGDSIIVRIGLSSGIYTIGPNADFFNLTEATEYIQNYGICRHGSFTFEIQDGTYYENILINVLPENRYKDSMTFKAKNSSNPKVYLSNMGNPFLFKLNACTNVNFENLQFFPNKNEEKFYGFVLSNEVQNISWRKCKFLGDSIGGGIGIYNFDNDRFKNLVIDSCEFINLDTSIFLYSLMSKHTPDLIIKNCEFENNEVAIELAYIAYGIIQNNKFSGIDQYCIKLDNCQRAFSINKNLFLEVSNRAIFINKFAGWLGYRSFLISNNYFSSMENVMALECMNSSFVGLIHNSLNLLNSPALIYIFKSQYFESKNNLFRTQKGHCAVFDKVTYFESDYNNYWLYESDSFYQKTFPNHLKIPYNLSDWQKLHTDDKNSTYIEPFFQSDTNPSVCNLQLDNKGIAISEIKTDFFGNIRNNQTPDIGAVEFTSQSIGSFLSDSVEACDSVVIVANIPENKYSYNWSNNSSHPVQNIFSSGLTKLTIQDTFCGSLFYDSTYVKIREATKYQFLPIPVQCDSLAYDLGADFTGLEVKWFNGVKESKTTFFQTDSIFFYYRDSTGCKGYSDTVFAEVPKSPMVNLGTDQKLDIIDTLKLSSGSFPKSVYKWSNGDSSQNLIIPASRLGVGSFQYWLSVTSDFNCIGFDSINVQVVDLGLVENLSDNNILCYPNPFTDKIHLELIGQNLNDWHVSITDKLGRVIFQKGLPANEHITFNLDDITVGVYLLKIESPKGIVHKLIYKI